MSREKLTWTGEIEWPIWGYGGGNGCDGYIVRVILDREDREIHVRITNEQLVAMGKAAQRRIDSTRDGE